MVANFNYFPLVAVSKIKWFCIGLLIDFLCMLGIGIKDSIKDISWQLLNLFIRLPRSLKRVYKTLITNLFTKSLENNSNRWNLLLLLKYYIKLILQSKKYWFIKSTNYKY